MTWPIRYVSINGSGRVRYSSTLKAATKKAGVKGIVETVSLMSATQAGLPRAFVKWFCRERQMEPETFGTWKTGPSIRKLGRGWYSPGKFVRYPLFDSEQVARMRFLYEIMNGPCA